jgi:hypothetical protein
MNRTLTGWFGEHHGHNCHSPIMGQESPYYHCKLRDIIEQGNKVRYYPTMAAGRTFEIVATPISNYDGTISIITTLRDSTEQKEQEERRLKTSRKKRTTQKN